MSNKKVSFAKVWFVSVAILAIVLSGAGSALIPVARASGSVDIWWPSSGATVQGVQPFKAMLRDWNINDYSMYWNVDGGQLNSMQDNWADYPHKEASVDLSSWKWKGNGPYRVAFIAKDKRGNVIGQNFSDIYTGAPAPISAAISPTKTVSPAVQNSAGGSGNPFSGAKLWTDPYSDAMRQAQTWSSSNPVDSQLMYKIANQPSTVWLGNWNSDVRKDANNMAASIADSGALPVFVVYNIPFRDCGSYSAGGSWSADEYRSWIRRAASGIGNRKAVVILEPDALALTDCLSQQDKQTRYQLLADAVSVFKAQGNSVYIDAGHPGWISSSEMASRLKNAGIDKADGFALNIANFMTDSDNISYGRQISSALGGKHFIIDSGRNGAGPASDGAWCNPPGRALGQKPTVNTGDSLVDAYLWVKGPSGSDGACNGAPPAGQFYPGYALDLARRAAW